MLMVTSILLHVAMKQEQFGSALPTVACTTEKGHRGGLGGGVVRPYEVVARCFILCRIGRYFASAARSMSAATDSGFDTITTCEAPAITTVSWEFARSAMKSSAAGGMFLS